MKRRILQSTLVIVLAVILTTFGIDAADTLQNRGGTLLSQVITSQDAECPEGMTVLTLREKRLCVDVFEVSPGEVCPVQRVGNALATRENLDTAACVPESADGRFPWAYVTFHQAKELCAKAGKRLPSSEEWYELALGTPDPTSNPPCNLESDAPRMSSEDSACINAYGVSDAIGNVWEWVDGAVVGGSYNGRALPESGYVVAADSGGMATLTHPENESSNFHEDYFWSSDEGTYGLLRGGFYASQSDGGLYTVQAKSALEISSAAIGFRCVLDT